MPRPDPADVPDRQPCRKGVLYCFTHSEMPGLVKVGATRKDPIVRATELSGGTGVPGAFTVAYYRGFVDCFAAERIAHEQFADARVDTQREFFRVEVSEVVSFIRDLTNELASTGREGGEWLSTGDATDMIAAETARLYPFAALFATFQEDGRESLYLTEEEQAKVQALRCAQMTPRLST